MRERVLVTGIGSISCFGVGASAFAAAVRSGAAGGASVARFSTDECRSHSAALIRDFDPAAFIAPAKLRRIDGVGRVTIAAARLALADAVCVPDAAGRDDIGVALGTYTAGVDSLVEYLDGLTTHGPTGVPAILFSNTVANAPASLAAIEFGLRGPNVTFNQREASSIAAIAYAVAAIRQGRASAMLSGGADWIEETFFKVHDRFRVLSPRRNVGSERARPFDRRRNGFVLGEGGFLLVLEAGASLAARGGAAAGEILGIGATGARADRNSWPEGSGGIAAAMRLALDDASLQPSEIDAILAASNGSPELDVLEAEAVADVFGACAVPVASIKGAIGESSAAGAAAVAAGLLSLPDGCLPPTAGCEELDEALRLRAGAAAQPVRGTTFLVNAIASGGTIYSVVLRATRRARS